MAYILKTKRTANILFSNHFIGTSIGIVILRLLCMWYGIKDLTTFKMQKPENGKIADHRKANF